MTKGSDSVSKLEVITWESYGDLSEHEQECVSNNGAGKEDADYLRVKYAGKTIFLMNDAIEPEDRTLGRDYSPLVEMVENAYTIGLAEGRGEVVNPPSYII